MCSPRIHPPGGPTSDAYPILIHLTTLQCTPGTEINHQEPVAAQGHPILQPNAPVGAWRRHAPTPAPTNTTKTTPHKTSASLRLCGEILASWRLLCPSSFVYRFDSTSTLAS